MKKVIGIDLGGTRIKAGIVNEEGQILREVEYPTPNEKNQVLDKLAEIINQLIDNEVLAIGIGSPGTIDSSSGKVLAIGGNIKDWAHTDIKGEITRRTHGDGSSVLKVEHSKKPSPCVPPIFVENDANLAALCEGWIGAGKGMESFIMLTLGTGLGGGIYTEEVGIYKGRNLQAGELGHAILYPHGRPCTCGQRGCVERYISGKALEELYFEASGERKSGQEIFRLSLENKIANQIVEEFTKNLAIYLSTLKNILDPQGIIIGGGVINSKEIWWEKMLDYYKTHTNTPTAQIHPAKHLNHAGIIGAGKRALNNSLAIVK